MKSKWKEIIIISLGMLLTSSAIYFFMVPGNLTVGGIAGLALIISKVIPFPISLITLVLNVILLILAYVFLGKDFAVKNIYATILLSLYLGIFEAVIPMKQSIMGDAWLDLICYVLLIGLSQAVLFTQNASTGGLDIVAKLLNQALRLDLGTAYTLAGFVVSLMAILVYDGKTVILGLLGTYLNGTVLDYFLVGFNSKKRVCIISDQHELIQKFIIETLQRGATLYPILGGLKNENKIEIETILTRNEFAQLMNYLQQIDKKAFITAGNVSEIYGNWNKK